MAAEANCFKIKNSVAMPDYEGVMMMKGEVFNDTATLDSYVLSKLDSNPDYEQNFR
jgi:hypothetical protein